MASMHLALILIGFSVLHPRMDALEKLGEPILWGPSAALEGSIEVFYCDIPEKPAMLSVQYELYVETNLSKIIGEYSSLSGENATIPLRIKKQHDGRLICKASGHNDSNIESSISKGLDFRVIVPLKEVSIISHPSVENIWEGQTLTLQCEKTKGTYVSYKWFWNNALVRMPYDRNEDILTIHRVSAQNSGNYTCVASNQLSDTMTYSSSSYVIVNIKEYVSKPEISIDVKKDDKEGYNAIIKCQSKKGTPPYTFSLFNYTDLIISKSTHTASVSLNMQIDLNRNMGQIICNASNEGNWVLSKSFNLTVESVGGAITVTLFKHVDPDFQVVGVVLSCKVERGVLPHYSWFLNGSRLLGRGGFYAVAPDESDLSLSVGRDSAGVYHCQASDRFDNSTSIRSPKMLISKQALNTVPPLVVIVVFSSFALLNVTVISCCIYGVVLRRRYSRKYPEMRITDKQEDEEEEDEYDLMLENYEEDVVQADRLSDSPEDEDQSVDETVLYEGAVSE